MIKNIREFMRRTPLRVCDEWVLFFVIEQNYELVSFLNIASFEDGTHDPFKKIASFEDPTYDLRKRNTYLHFTHFIWRPELVFTVTDEGPAQIGPNFSKRPLSMRGTFSANPDMK